MLTHIFRDRANKSEIFTNGLKGYLEIVLLQIRACLFQIKWQFEKSIHY